MGDQTMNESQVTEYEKYRRKLARRENIHLYLGMLTMIMVGYISAPMFSAWSVISTLILLVWAIGIVRQSQLMTSHLEAIEPELKKMVASGMSEHDAMMALGCDKYYYKPFWAIY